VRYELRTPEQATSLMQSLWPKVKEAIKGGKQLSLEIKPINKSREQEEKYHAMIGEIAKQAQHLGAKWPATSQKNKQASLLNGYILGVQITESLLRKNYDG